MYIPNREFLEVGRSVGSFLPMLRTTWLGRVYTSCVGYLDQKIQYYILSNLKIKIGEKQFPYSQGIFNIQNDQTMNNSLREAINSSPSRGIKIFTRDPIMAKAALKSWRFNPDGYTIHPDIPEALNDTIFFVNSKEVNKKLRSVYSNLLHKKGNANHIKNTISNEWDNLFSTGQKKISTLTEDEVFQKICMIALHVSAGCKPTKDMEQFMVEKVPNTLEEVTDMPSILPHEEELFPAFMKAASEAGLNDRQKYHSLITFLFVMKLNLSKGLTHLLRQLEEEPLLLSWIRWELEVNSPSIESSPYILKIVAESLRLAQVVSLVEREIQPDKVTTLYDKCPYKQVSLTVDLSAMAMSPELVGDNPSKFSLERPYLQDLRSIRNLPFLSFGSGHDQCPAWLLYQWIAMYFVAGLAKQEKPLKIALLDISIASIQSDNIEKTNEIVNCLSGDIKKKTLRGISIALAQSGNAEKIARFVNSLSVDTREFVLRSIFTALAQDGNRKKISEIISLQSCKQSKRALLDSERIAIELALRGDVKGAIGIVKSAISNDPAVMLFVSYHHDIVKTLAWMGNSSGAIDYVNAGICHDAVKDYFFRSIISIALVQTGEIDKVKEIVKADPLLVTEEIFEQLIETGEIDNAVVMDNAIKLASAMPCEYYTQTWAFGTLCEELVKLGRLNQVLKVLDAIPDQHSKISVFGHMCKGLAQLGRINEVIAVVNLIPCHTSRKFALWYIANLKMPGTGPAGSGPDLHN